MSVMPFITNKLRSNSNTTPMRQILFLMLLLSANFSYAQTQQTAAKPLLQGKFLFSGKGNSVPKGDYNPKGELPPAWLKNKVSEAQYDSLAALNKLCMVDYSAFKGVNISATDIADIMTKVKSMLNNKNTLSTSDGEIAYFGLSSVSKTLKPWQKVIKEEDKTKAQYIAYSSIDGYDAHILITYQYTNDKTTGQSRSNVGVFAYSLSGNTVKLENSGLDFLGNKSAKEIVFDANGLSNPVALHGTLVFDDPLGYHHSENVNVTFCLMMPKD